MYIENLTEKDLQTYANMFKCNIAEINRTNNEIYLKLIVDAMGPQPEIWLSDFNLITSNYYKEFEKELKKQYVLFLNKKFGKKYKKDYIENYKKLCEDEKVL